MDDFAKGSLIEPGIEQGSIQTDPRYANYGEGYEGGGKIMWVKVYSPSQVYYDEPATSISAVNLTGPFDILPKHHNFITLLQPCVLEIRQPERMESQRIKISGGLMHIKADRVVVFLDV